MEKRCDATMLFHHHDPLFLTGFLFEHHFNSKLHSSHPTLTCQDFTTTTSPMPVVDCFAQVLATLVHLWSGDVVIHRQLRFRHQSGQILLHLTASSIIALHFVLESDPLISNRHSFYSDSLASVLASFRILSSLLERNFLTRLDMHICYLV
jgi:hypothetical protein